ncbi:ketopantoate reductase family protein [Desulfolithobacter sp.]
MTIVIAGPGALGSLLTARVTLFLQTRVSQSPTRLWLLDYRPDRAERLNRAGILLKENVRSVSVPVKVTARPADISACDILICCTKTATLRACLDHASPMITPDTLVIGMQNGILHPDILRQSRGIAAVGITSEGATLEGEGRVRHGGSGLTRFGLLDQSTPEATGRLRSLARMFEEAGFQSRCTDNPEKYIWHKLFINVGINALSAIYNRTNGQLLTSCSLREPMKKAVAEAVSVARALGIEVETDPVRSVFQVCRQTRHNVSSMLQDVRNKKPTEIGAINGAVVALGKKLGIPTPVNENLVQRVRRLEAMYDEQDSSSRNG